MSLILPKLEDINQIYSGRSGCMCGCRGKYFEGKKIGRIVNNMKKYAETNNSTIYIEGEHIYLDDGNKNYVIYLKENLNAKP